MILQWGVTTLSNRAFGLFVFCAVLSIGVFVAGINRGWFSADQKIAKPEIPAIVDQVDENTSKPQKAKPLHEVLGVDEDDMTVIGGVQRRKSDTAFAEPLKVDYGDKNPTAIPNAPHLVKRDVNDTTTALAKDLRSTETRRVASSTYASIEKFD